MTESFYELLGIEPDADEDEIRRAYREQLKETHPDVSDDPEADTRTRRLVDAKETLLDPAERSRYDRIGHDAYVARGADTRTSDGDATTGTNARNEGSAATSAGRADWASADADGKSGPTNASTDPWERRAREERAQERVETGGTWGGDTANSTTTSTGTTSGGTTEQTNSPTDSRFDVSVEPGDVKDRGPWLSIGEAPATTLAAFLLYPVLLGSAVFPAFPLWVNVVVATCTVAVIAALQAMPGVGVIVFGSWSVAGTIGLAIGGVPPLSFVGLLVLGGTWFPFGLSLLTAWILRP